MRISFGERLVEKFVLRVVGAALTYLVSVAVVREIGQNCGSTIKARQHKKDIAKRLGRPLIDTNSYEVFNDVGLDYVYGLLASNGECKYICSVADPGIILGRDEIACDVINPDDIDVEFNSIGGLESRKQELFELVILPLQRPELFSRGKLLAPQKGVLLYGPPGTGKTMLAKAIAKESGAVFINVKMSNLMNKWFGESQKLVSAVFSLAYKLQPAIIFIDEVDSFLGQRKDTDHVAIANMKTEFMALWDGFTTDQNARVMVLAATNRPSELDEAILRRFSQSFEIGMPDERERAEILKVVLKGECVDDDIKHEYIARLCDGYTGSDLYELCKKAAYLPIREILDDEKNGKPCYDAPRPLKQSDMEEVLATSKKTKVAAGEYSRRMSFCQLKKDIAKRLGRPLIDTNSYEDVIACDVINPDDIDVEFNSIGGLESRKQELFELVILPLQRPELFSRGKLLAPQKGILLYGPPGTGKTMLAKAIAKESGALFINVKMSNLMNKWFGESQKLVSAVFSLANKLQPAIIFIDEVDSFLGQRKDTDHVAIANMKTEFMALWDGFTTDQNARVMVLAATNRPSELDEAILRRFSQSFEIGMPDERERAEILKVVLKGECVDDDIKHEYIARLCDGYTGSDLYELCKKAAYLPIREMLDDEKNGKPYDAPRPLKQSDMEEVLATSKKTKVAAGEYSSRMSQSSSCAATFC